ncbi:hypothetical protein FRACA_2200006 [Frankia canadensis]|uniref:Uncharacterized protein n=1 Tax=Frankia canadensis TaxID=1836972 RepID=A0A2I2KR25_9ACTN|nr:hypothetical protein FRACA_2200006 [Frankia canadensis]SOU55402.1 hypothetical protein FRACA_2200006 [Frankia canadensis]
MGLCPTRVRLSPTRAKVFYRNPRAIFCLPLDSAG